MRTMIDLELDILLRKKLGVRRNKYKYTIPRQCGKLRLALRNLFTRFFEEGCLKGKKDNLSEDLLCN